jgi:hypothetical protein
MNDTLIFKVDEIEHEIELDGSRAPNTLSKVLTVLPSKVDVHCAKIAGSHIMWPMPFVERVEAASDVLAIPPGAFFFWPERQYLEISYAALQAESASVSYLGRLRGNVDWLRDYADRQRQAQGREIFTAELFMRGGGSVPPNRAAAALISGSAGQRLLNAREDAWRQQPDDIRALLDRRGLNLPFGPLAMAEGELRKLHELLWLLWNEGDRRSDAAKREIATFALQAAIARVGGFCHMQATASILLDGIECLRSPQLSVADVLVELVLYVGRMAAWLDLHISWWPINELTLRNLDTRQAT